MNLRIWPSLRGWVESSNPIPTRRAVYGKVHRAPTDYRWIAWSSGFDPGPAPLQKELALGSEDAATLCYCWRSSPSAGAVAMKCYPSRAYDAAGRPTGVEKQVLSAPLAKGVPSVAMAFLLLPDSVPFDDSVWWESWRDPRWKSLDYHLPIPETQCPEVSSGDLAARVKQGIAELFESVPDEALEDFYARLLAGTGPAILRIDEKPFPPLALAALLLPLEPELAERVTLAGGFPSRTFDPQRLAHWSGIACPPQIPLPDLLPVPQNFRERAAEFVRVLKGGQPTAGAAVILEKDLSEGASYLLQFLDSPERWFKPGVPGTRSLADVAPWPIVRRQDESAMLRERVHRFVSDVEAMPASSAQRQLVTKADLLKAMILVLCPGQETLAAVALPTSHLVPALYFASRIYAEDWREFARYTEPEFQVLARQSLRETTVPAMVAEVMDWLRNCAGRADAGEARAYAEGALERFAATESPRMPALPGSVPAPTKSEA